MTEEQQQRIGSFIGEMMYRQGLENPPHMSIYIHDIGLLAELIDKIIEEHK